MPGLERLSGRWTRDYCETRGGYNFDNGLCLPPKDTPMPKEVRELLKRAVKFEDGVDTSIHPCFFTNLSSASAKYTSDGSKDVWISHFKVPGDCDSMSIASAHACYVLCDDWIPGIALGKAWLSAGKHSGKTTKAIINHAYPIFINKKTGKICMIEATYAGKFNDKGPGTGHFIECSWIILPGGCLRVDANHNGWVKGSESGESGKNAPIGSTNPELEKGVQEKVDAAFEDIKEKYNQFSNHIENFGIFEFQYTYKNGIPVIKEVVFKTKSPKESSSSDSSSSKSSSNKSSSESSSNESSSDSSSSKSSSNESSSKSSSSSDSSGDQSSSDSSSSESSSDSSDGRILLKPSGRIRNMFKDETRGFFSDMVKSTEEKLKEDVVNFSKGIF